MCDSGIAPILFGIGRKVVMSQRGAGVTLRVFRYINRGLKTQALSNGLSHEY